MVKEYISVNSPRIQWITYKVQPNFSFVRFCWGRYVSRVSYLESGVNISINMMAEGMMGIHLKVLYLGHCH